MVCQIPLPDDEFALVDPEIFEQLGHLRWCRTGVGHVGRRQCHSGSWVYLHRTIMAPELARSPELHVHHKNGNPLDNRRENMTLLTQGEHRRLHVAEAPPVRGRRWKGVWLDKGKWKACIIYRGTKYCLGTFPFDQLDAALRARDDAAYRFYGADCWLNQPERFGLPARSDLKEAA